MNVCVCGSKDMTMSKNIVVFGGSSASGQHLTGELVSQGHRVINVDHNKSEVPGVTRYPFDLGSHQTKGILSVMKPDVVISCETAQDQPQHQLEFLSRLCDIMSHAQDHNVGTVVVVSHGRTVDSAVEAINQITPDTTIKVVADISQITAEDFT